MRHLFLSFLALAVAWPAIASAQFLRTAGPGREMRESVAAHRAEQREEIRVDEAAAGRRLTPAERLELREQLRSQWAVRAEATQTAESQNTVSGWRAFLPWTNSRP